MSANANRTRICQGQTVLIFISYGGHCVIEGDQRAIKSFSDSDLTPYRH